jgi:hypothetical protein
MMGTKHQKKVRNQQLQSAALRSVGVEETPGSTNPQKSVPQKAGLRVRAFFITYIERGRAGVPIVINLKDISGLYLSLYRTVTLTTGQSWIVFVSTSLSIREMALVSE